MARIAFSPIAYIAQTLLAKDHEPGTPPQWCFVDKDIRENYMCRAKRLVDTWRNEEQAVLVQSREIDTDASLSGRRVRVVHPDKPENRELYWQLHTLLHPICERFATFASAEEHYADFYILFKKPWTEEFAPLYEDMFWKAPTVFAIPSQFDHLLEEQQVWPLKEVSL